MYLQQHQLSSNFVEVLLQTCLQDHHMFFGIDVNVLSSAIISTTATSLQQFSGSSFLMGMPLKIEGSFNLLFFSFSSRATWVTDT